MAVEEWREATIFETSYQFVGKLGRIFARIGDENLELLSCASVSHGLSGSRPESRTHEIGHMCRTSATADLIGEIRYSALDQTIFPICSRKRTSDCVLMVPAPVQGRMGWYCGLAAESMACRRCSLMLASSACSSAMKQRLRLALEGRDTSLPELRH